MKLDDILIIVSEIDGIITTGNKPIDHLNYTPFKYFYERDFEAINELKKFFTFAFLADDPDVSYNVMRTRNIPAFFVSKKETKLQILQNKIMNRYNMTPENLIYIGNKLSDIPCMNYAEIALTIPDSSMQVQRVATSTLTAHAGYGVISKLYEVLYPEIEKRQRR